MKGVTKLIAISLVLAVACVFSLQGNTYADDWDDAGKILAGVLGGYIGHEVLDNIFDGDSYYSHRRRPAPRYYYYSSRPRRDRYSRHGHHDHRDRCGHRRYGRHNRRSGYVIYYRY